jgi:hypothetical protein
VVEDITSQEKVPSSERKDSETDTENKSETLSDNDTSE